VTTDGFVFSFRNGRVSAAPRLSKHYDSAKDASPPPPSVDWSAKAALSLSRMYLNDTYGDCVIAGKGHGIGITSGNESGAPVIATDTEIYQNYQSICGPGDNGCVITDVLDAMKAGRFVMAGTPAQIDGYAGIDWTNKQLVQVCLEVFGWLTIGINLTDDCTDAGPGVKWTFSGQIVGGHDVTCYAYDEHGVYISTWGKVGTLIPWANFLVNAGNGPGIEEAYVSLAPTWYNAGNLAPNGIDAKTLAADLALAGQGQVPPLPGPTPAPPTPPVPPGPVPVPPAPTPPVPPVPMTLPNYNVTLSGSVPGLFGSHTITLSGTATPVGSGGGPGAIPWATILALLAQFGAKVLPVILADIAAKKPLAQILADCISAVLSGQ
jgi:hypothetical protein